jgi:hypothetical protein
MVLKLDVAERALRGSVRMAVRCRQYGISRFDNPGAAG